MSRKAVERVQAEFGDRVLEASAFRGDDEARVAAEDWAEVAGFLRDDPKLAMDHFIDLTAVDFPDREPDEARFDLVLSVRSSKTLQRIRLRTRVEDGAKAATLTSLWVGADWAEREVYDMFGIEFEGHPDLRRILLYDEFEGYPLRKDYPIERTQPLVAYRTEDTIQKLPPFGVEEGQPWTRIQWADRIAHEDEHVSPSLALQLGERRSLSDSEAAIPTAAADAPIDEPAAASTSEE